MVLFRSYSSYCCLQADESAATGAAAEDAPLDPKLELVRAIVEMLSGRSIRVLSSEDIQADAAAEAPAGQGGSRPAFGIEYSRSETIEHYEAASFEAAGTVRTADGRDISFSLSLSMQRYESETRSLSLRAGSAVAKDPLVLNFGADAASLRSQRFSFDLLGNGDEVDMPLLGEGSGFLVLDAVGSGRVESGRQLFGPTSGDGFADLAAYDSDANGWIDEADPVFGPDYARLIPPIRGRIRQWPYRYYLPILICRDAPSRVAECDESLVE